MVQLITIVSIVPDPENYWLLSWVENGVHKERQFAYFQDLSRYADGELLADGWGKNITRRR